YLGMISSRVQIQARQTLTENTYFMLERLNAVVSDFTIDYEVNLFCFSSTTSTKFAKDFHIVQNKIIININNIFFIIQNKF
ncbi:hypothetical protein, partial [Candidatus Vampirococcus lugosii]